MSGATQQAPHRVHSRASRDERHLTSEDHRSRQVARCEKQTLVILYAASRATAGSVLRETTLTTNFDG